jgi:HEAT repeat protein
VISGLKTTFNLLAHTQNESAVELLIAALDSAEPRIREGAIRAIIERRSLRAQRELIRRWHKLGAQRRELCDDLRGHMTKALREALAGSDEQMAINACQAILVLREYEMMGTLVAYLDEAGKPRAKLAARTLLDLADLLYDELISPRDYHNRRDPQLVRRNVISSLEKAVQRFETHGELAVVEAFLILASREDAALKHVLLDPLNPSYPIVVSVLVNSRRSSVMRLLLSYLEDGHAPWTALNVLAQRHDVTFVRQLLRKLSPEPSPTARANLRRIEHFAWGLPERGVLDELDNATQGVAIAALAGCGAERGEVFQAVAHVLQHGRPAGRRAAAAALAEFTGPEADQLVHSLLGDGDPHVQAEAVRTLRARGLPGAVTRLLELVDSPYDVVRQAACDNLPEFRFERFLASFETLDETARRSTGLLVRKIDPDALPQLRAELVASSRLRRLKALEMVTALGVAAEFEPELTERLHDEDPLVRLEAARTLAAGESPGAAAALRTALSDEDLLVRQTVQTALTNLHQKPRNPSLGARQ